MVKNLKLGRLEWVIRWPSVLTRVLIRSRQEGQSERRHDTEQRLGSCRATNL